MSPQSPVSPLSHKSTPKSLPQGWKWVKLGEIAECIDYGYTASADDKIVSPKFLRITDIQNGTVNWDTVPGCSIDSTLINDYRLINGDIVFARTGATTGKSYQIIDPPEAVFASYLIRVQANQNIVFSDFLYLYFQSDEYWKIINSGMRGGALAGFNASMLKTIECPLPPLPEQQRIASILKEKISLVEQARKAAKERLEAIKALPSALLRQVFPQPGQPLPEEWKWMKLGKITNVVNGTTPPSENKLYWNGNIVWITPTDLGKLSSPEITDSERRITYEGFEICNLSLVPPGTVVMSSRAPIGHLGIATIELCTNQGCKSFVPSSEIDTYYLYYALKKSIPKLKELGSGATFNEVSKSQCEKFDILIPSLSEQKHISALLQDQMTAADKARKVAEEELATINALPAAILRKAFNGEI